MKLSDAKNLADELVQEMSHFSDRLLIAGSIRREKSEVKDIEIVAIPQWSYAVPDRLKIPSFVKKQKSYASDYAFERIPSNYELFGNADNEKSDVPKGGENHNLLFLWANRQNLVRWIKPGAGELISWEIKSDGKYWRGVIESEKRDPIKLDLFLAKENNWGVISTIRTGPAEFSTALVTFIKNNTKFRVEKGLLWDEDTGSLIACPEEEDLFKAVGLRFIPVGMRSAANPHSLFRMRN